MADPKTPPPAELLEGTVFVVNPTGAIHDMDENDTRNLPVLELARKSKDDWRLATDEEIVGYCKLNNIDTSTLKGKAAAEPAAKASTESSAPKASA